MVDLQLVVAVHPPRKAGRADQQDVEHPRDEERARKDGLVRENLKDSGDGDGERHRRKNSGELTDARIRPDALIQFEKMSEDMVARKQDEGACGECRQPDRRRRCNEPVPDEDRQQHDDGIDQDE